MRTIIAGSRTIRDYALLERAIVESGFHITEVVSGKESKGVDRLGEIWAERHSIPVKWFPADWSLGRKAGPIRNRQMAEYADALLALWDGKSKGTKNMIDTAMKMNITVCVYRVDIANALLN